MKSFKILDLIKFTEESLKQVGYAKDYILNLSHTWKALTMYVSEKNIHCYSPTIGKVFLQERYNICTNDKFIGLSEVDKRRKRAILFLNNCLEHEKVIVPKSYALCKFAPQFNNKFQKFIEQRSTKDLSLSTLNRDIACLNKFSDYLNKLNIQVFEELESVHIIGFMKSCSITRKLPTLAGIASTLRLLLTFLYDDHDLSKQLSTLVPQVKHKFDGIPSCYTKDEVQQLLQAVERTSPVGKRNYAMILLAARLGMRASDICGLLLDNLKWQTNTIEFIVKKTCEAASLPLLNEIGEAIIEYLRYGRPKSEDHHVFLRMQTPLLALNSASMHRIVSLNLRNANIPILPGKRHGPHALRASLASAMLANNTTLPVISETLTHKNTDTTRFYLKIDMKHLREYSLEVPSWTNAWTGGIKR